MTRLTGNHLALIVQALDAKIAGLEGRLDELPSAEGAELESLLLAYSNTAAAVKRAYEEALSESANLPPYESLVRSG